MARAENPILLTGTVPGEATEDVLQLTGPAVGDLVFGLTDGERGPRAFWVFFVALGTYEGHPQLEKTRSPQGIPGMPPWVPAGYHDFPQFRVKDDVQNLHFEPFGYAAAAKESYETFCALRQKGVIPAKTRFQVSLPFPEDTTRLFTATARDLHLMANAYQATLVREVSDIVAAIPADDLVVQWDINWETVAVAVDDFIKGQDPMAFRCEGDPMARYESYMKTLAACVPDEVPMGLHLCYGELHHKHFVEPEDLSVCVQLANVAPAAAGRRIDYVHMPVPRSRHDEAYMAPLTDFNLDGATLYAGLIHQTGGLEGALRRLEALKRYYDGPLGVATECGLGMRAPESIPTLLALHREVVEHL